MRPSESTLKRLFAHSGNQCAFPRCTAPLTHNDTLIGEVCHIKGDKPGSARFDDLQKPADRQAYANLIVLCPNHHTVIDDDEVAYTVDRLLHMKSEHEAASATIPDAEAMRVASLFVAQDFSNVAQSGGVAAQNIHAQTINVNSSGAVDSITATRQLRAIEALWGTMRGMRNEFGQLIFVDTIFTREEIRRFFETQWPSKMRHMNEYADRQTVMRKFETVRAFEADHERPFVSHRLWSVYYITRALYGRVGYLFEESFGERAYRDWRTDSGTDQLLRAILPANAVEQIKSTTVSALQSAFDYLEEQFMAEAKMRSQ